MKENNIIIRRNFVVYNTKNLYDEGKMIKIPSYVIADVMLGNKNLILKHNNVNLKFYSCDEVKHNLISIERKVFQGIFRKQPIEYNLTRLGIV